MVHRPHPIRLSPRLKDFHRTPKNDMILGGKETDISILAGWQEN